MEKFISNISIGNYNKSLKYNKNLFIGKMKSVQMIDGILIFELEKTFWETLHSAIKKHFGAKK